MEGDNIQTVYAFVAEVEADHVVGAVLSQAGEFIGGRTAPDMAALRANIEAALHEELHKRFPDGFHLVFIDNPNEAIGFASAIRDYYEIQNHSNNDTPRSDQVD